MGTRTSDDPESTRTTILAAARLQFGAKGFDRTTIRSVAAAAGVDPALVMHYFHSKDGLFTAASELEISLPDLSGVAPDRIADVLLPVFIGLWGPGGPFLPLLRAASSNRVAVDALLKVFTDQVTPALAVVAPDHASERAALVGSQLLGVAVARYVLANPPLVAMDQDTLVRWLRPVIAHYLTGPAPH